MFRRDCPATLREAQQAIDSRNGVELTKVGHSLRGVLSNLSAAGASTMAAELEACGHSEDFPIAQVTLSRLSDEIDQVTRALESLCQVSAQ
jgi:HPt (histidine-containing phosphotransfer) domain-containing protein